LHAGKDFMPAQTTPPPFAHIDWFVIIVAAFMEKYMEWAYVIAEIKCSAPIKIKKNRELSDGISWT